MSYTNFIKAMELAPKCKFYTTAGGKSEEEIKNMRYDNNIVAAYKIVDTCAAEFKAKSMGICPFSVMKYMELIQRMIREY